MMTFGRGSLLTMANILWISWFWSHASSKHGMTGQYRSPSGAETHFSTATSGIIPGIQWDNKDNKDNQDNKDITLAVIAYLIN